MKFRDDYNMSLLLLLPLVSIEFTKAEQLLEGYDKAFINGFSSDINKPFIDKHVHLVFDNSMYKEKDVETLISLEQLEYIASYRMSGVFVKSYALRLDDGYSLSIKKILEGNCSDLSSDIKHKIITFWNAPADSALFNALYGKGCELDPNKDVLPEEDYIDKTETAYVTNFTLHEKSWYGE